MRKFSVFLAHKCTQDWLVCFCSESYILLFHFFLSLAFSSTTSTSPKWIYEVLGTCATFWRFSKLCFVLNFYSICSFCWPSQYYVLRKWRKVFHTMQTSYTGPITQTQKTWWYQTKSLLNGKLSCECSLLWFLSTYFPKITLSKQITDTFIHFNLHPFRRSTFSLWIVHMIQNEHTRIRISWEMERRDRYHTLQLSVYKSRHTGINTYTHIDRHTHGKRHSHSRVLSFWAACIKYLRHFV